MNAFAVAASALTLAIAAAAVAQSQPLATGMHHGMMQPETRAEAQAKAAAAFDMLDLNHDGRLDAADHALRVGQMFDRIDANHDGMISRDEFAAAHPPFGMRQPMDGMAEGAGKRMHGMGCAEWACAGTTCAN